LFEPENSGGLTIMTRGELAFRHYGNKSRSSNSLLSGDETAARELKRGFGDTVVKMLGRAQIGFRRREVGDLVGIRLRAGAQPEAEPIHILLRSRCGVVPRQQTVTRRAMGCPVRPDDGWRASQDGPFLCLTGLD